jgi:hypothetical protein
MTEGDDLRNDAVEWLREPPSAREIRVLVECGEEAELTPDAQNALEHLMSELADAEVQGYAAPLMTSFSIMGVQLGLQGACITMRCSGKHECASHSCDSYSSALI